jgi:hypothetical protein
VNKTKVDVDIEQKPPKQKGIFELKKKLENGQDKEVTQLLNLAIKL